MRVLLPIRALIEEVMKNVDIPPALRTLGNHIRATVHEDNTSCLTLATDQRITSRTRHMYPGISSGTMSTKEMSR